MNTSRYCYIKTVSHESQQRARISVSVNGFVHAPGRDLFLVNLSFTVAFAYACYIFPCLS